MSLLFEILNPFSRIPGGLKGRAETGYWLWQQWRQKGLSNAHYVYFFTEHFELTPAFYQDKRMLDIGCGPRGSLEWANQAKTRIGLDPLAHQYLQMGGKSHQMKYVQGGVEQIPFPDNSFDVITSFNSLDHITDLSKAIAEIQRVLAPNGFFLLLTDVGHKPTITEPLSFGWEIVTQFQPTLMLVAEKHFEKTIPHALYESLRHAIPFNHENSSQRYGILSAKFRKVTPPL